MFVTKGVGGVMVTQGATACEHLRGGECGGGGGGG